MGVRIDLPGIRWWDYHTVGAGTKMRISELSDPKSHTDVGPERAAQTTLKDLKYKDGPLLSQREYLADASFLVALQGDPEIISMLSEALRKPIWTLYLGRKSCPPSRPVGEHEPGFHLTLEDALASVPVQLRTKNDICPASLQCILDWIPAFDGEPAPETAEIHYDIPRSFQPPSHQPRFVVRKELHLKNDVDAQQVPIGKPWYPSGSRADYNNTEYKKARAERLVIDNGLCMVCKAPATTVQHVNYRRAGGKEESEDLRSLCRLCHDACTMLEYGAGMGMDRIDPCNAAWREKILAKRSDIVRFRSLKQRRRKLNPEEENG